MEAVIEVKGLVTVDGIGLTVRAGDSLLGTNGGDRTTAVEEIECLRTKNAGFGIVLFGMRASIDLAVALMGNAGGAPFSALGMLVARFTKGKETGGMAANAIVFPNDAPLRGPLRA